MERRLAAILAADVVGYSRIMSKDEEGTITRIGALRDELIAGLVETHKGRIFKTMGDGVLAEFPSAVEAVRCADEIQTSLRSQNDRLPVDLRMDLRIGVNLGDVVSEGADLLGDGVNVAARLEQIAEPGGIAISGSVQEQIAGRIATSFRDIGYRTLKNIDRPVHVYQSNAAGEPAKAAGGLFDFGADAKKNPEITGGCLCGLIRYESREAPLGSGYCHCRTCQKFIGAPVSVWTAFASDALRFTGQEPKIFMSSPIAERGFCPGCGTGLTYRLTRPGDAGYVVVFTATLDHPERFPPTSHGGIESRIPWLDIHDELPRTRCDESWTLRAAWASVGREDPANWGPGEAD